jgi:hypothetical protein
MNDAINKFDEMARKYNSTAMLAMQANDFLRYFGAIYSELNNFYNAANSSEQRTSAQIIEKCHQLLRSALDHHMEKSQPTNADSVKLFNSTRELLIQILWRDLEIGDREHEEFDAVEIDFRALRACGLKKPGGYQLTVSGRWKTDEIDEAALNYATNNILHFSKFIYNIASGQPDDREYLLNSPQREWVNLYKKVKQLHTDFALIGTAG